MTRTTDPAGSGQHPRARTRPQSRPLGAQLSHMLKDRGVTHVFGIPGVHNQEMYRGIEEAGLTHVLARHEQGAGFMADGYARATGKPGVCYVITGPGLCNIMTPMGQGYSDSVSMLVLSSCLDETAAKQGQLHQMKDQEIAAGTVCDWSHTAQTAEAAYQLVDRALTEFQTDRPRPKHIQVPIAQLEASADPAPAKTSATPSPLQGEAAAWGQLADRLFKARKPLFIFGGGIAASQRDQMRPDQRADWLEAFARTGAASFVTYAGRGVIPADDALHFGAFLARPESADIIGQADLVVAVGTTLSEVDLWRDHLGHRSGLVRIDIDAEVLSDLQRADILIHADAAGLIHAFPAKPHQTEWMAAEVAQAKARWRAQTDAERPGIVPLCDALKSAAPADTMYYSDMTQFAYVAKEVTPMDRPGHWHHPYGFGTLGYALPAAIGGAIARPNLPTICIIGDYGFQYTMAELATAVELQLPLPIILWDNGKLKEIEDSMVRAQIAPNAVTQQNPNFPKLADAFGAHAAAPQTIERFKEAIQTALKADRPTIIHTTPQITA